MLILHTSSNVGWSSKTCLENTTTKNNNSRIIMIIHTKNSTPIYHHKECLPCQPNIENRKVKRGFLTQFMLIYVTCLSLYLWSQFGCIKLKVSLHIYVKMCSREDNHFRILRRLKCTIITYICLSFCPPFIVNMKRP